MNITLFRSMTGEYKSIGNLVYSILIIMLSDLKRIASNCCLLHLMFLPVYGYLDLWDRFSKDPNW